MLEIIQGWSKEAQQAFFVASLLTLVLTTIAVTFFVCDALKVIVRGYDERPSGIEANDCFHRDSLSEKCIKADGNCATQDECNYEISKRSPLPMTSAKPTKGDPP